VGEVIRFPVERVRRDEPLLDYEAAARALGRSKRWLQYRVREGMPHYRTDDGEVRFRLTEAREWLARRRSA